MLVTLESLNAASPDTFLAELAGIFERTPWIAQAACAKRPFPTLAALLQSMTDAVRSADTGRQKLLIKAHPDLGATAGRTIALTAASKAEQAGARLDHLSNSEFEHFHRLNAAYQSKFNMPFVLCVRRHSKDSILRQFERRLQNARDAEIEEALTEIFRIAALRLADHVIAPDQLKVHGLLSAHVLDTSRGRPAEGVAVELVALSGTDEIHPLATRRTNAGGRTDRPLIEKQPLPIGRYELRFSMAEYFTRQGVGGDPPFLDVVPVRFAIAEPEAHYHIPLLATPWSYATYRGS
jgi:2-oxo-4-hydroxy-4-carboxy-5-ureidoimidazoline decarboxylase